MTALSSKKFLEIIKISHILVIDLIKFVIFERISMTFGEKVRQLRKRKKLTQEQLALLIGTHESHIGRYEKDQSSPTASIIKKLAEVFNVSTDYLLFDNKEEQSASVKISDNELLHQFQEVDKMDEDKRTLVKRVISMAINEDKIKQMVS